MHPMLPSHGLVRVRGLMPPPLQGQGLNERQLRLCDGFVYIPQV